MRACVRERRQSKTSRDRKLVLSKQLKRSRSALLGLAWLGLALLGLALVCLHQSGTKNAAESDIVHEI